MYEGGMRSENVEIGFEYENGWFSYGKEASMDTQIDLKNVYTWSCYTMKCIGIWPDERKWNRSSSYVVLIPFFLILCFICIPQTVNLPLIADDFNLIIENLSMGNITFTITVLKICIFWSHGKPLKSLLKCMNHDWNTVTEDTEREAMVVIAKITKKIIVRSAMLIQTVIFTYMLLRLYSGKYSEHKLLFRAYYPYNVDISPNYELTMVAQFVATIYAATSYTLVDIFVAMLILHVCAQLTNLKNQLKKFQTYDKQDLHTKLKTIVQKHVYLTRFVGTVENCCNGMLLIQMIGCTVQLCFQCLQAIMPLNGIAKDYFFFQITFLSVYVVYVMLQLYLYCYVGEKLSVESTDLADAAYECEWYNLSPRNAKLLVIIICRARTPLSITAGSFCSFSLLLYSQILVTTMTPLRRQVNVLNILSNDNVEIYSSLTKTLAITKKNVLKTSMQYISVLYTIKDN